jgi:hypothetical protein
MKMTRLAVLVIGGLVSTGSLAWAQGPVAVVEDVTGRPAGVEFMDYVEAGKVIRLGSGDSIVLSYLRSCVRETITGGTVTVGTERSEVQAGKVDRATVECNAGKMLLTAEQAKQSAGMVFRSLPTKKVPEPQFTLYGVSPVLEFKGGGTVLIERIDQPGERYSLTIRKEELARGAFYDLAKVNKTLTPGGIYRVSFGPQQMVFKIDPNVRPGPAPIVGRLLRIVPAS